MITAEVLNQLGQLRNESTRLTTNAITTSDKIKFVLSRINHLEPIAVSEDVEKYSNGTLEEAVSRIEDLETVLGIIAPSLKYLSSILESDRQTMFDHNTRIDIIEEIVSKRGFSKRDRR